MWQEITALAKVKPVVASIADVAASVHGYYLSMAANSIVAERLTLIGFIGVVLGKAETSYFFSVIVEFELKRDPFSLVSGKFILKRFVW
jgi:ClpP class serine protease